MNAKAEARSFRLFLCRARAPAQSFRKDIHVFLKHSIKVKPRLTLFLHNTSTFGAGRAQAGEEV
jgi:hypothetical protein